MADLYDKLVTLLRKNGDLTQADAANKLGVSLGQVNMLAFCRAKVTAGVVSKAPATAQSVKKLRNQDGDRWEMIAARTGLSVAKVKDLFGGEDAAAKSSVGRGRPAGAKTGGTKTKAAGTRTGGKTTAARRGGSKTGVARNKTRAARRGGNPS